MELVSGNIFIRPMAFAEAGDSVQGHVHQFDHTTYVVRGAVRVEKVRLDPDDAVVEVLQTVEKRAVDGHNWLLIEAKACHRITALEDNSLCHCIYSHRTAQGEIVQTYDGWMEGYR